MSRCLKRKQGTINKCGMCTITVFFMIYVRVRYSHAITVINTTFTLEKCRIAEINILYPVTVVYFGLNIKTDNIYTLLVCL